MKYILKTREGLYLEHTYVKGVHTWSLNPHKLYAGLYSQSSAYRLRRRFVNCRIYKTMTGYVLYTMVDGYRKYVTHFSIIEDGPNILTQVALDSRVYRITDHKYAKDLAKKLRCIIQEVAI